jgi:hypothetical protein
LHHATRVAAIRVRLQRGKEVVSLLINCKRMSSMRNWVTAVLDGTSAAEHPVSRVRSGCVISLLVRPPWPVGKVQDIMRTFAIQLFSGNAAVNPTVSQSSLWRFAYLSLRVIANTRSFRY